MQRFLSGVFLGAVAVAMTVPLVGMAQSAGNSKVTAPFTVYGSGGKALMTVTESNGGGLLTLNGPSGQKVIAGTNPQGGMSVAAYGNETNFLYMTSDADGGTFGLSRNGKELVNLGVKPGKTAVLNIGNADGNIVAQVGSNPSQNGAGAVYVKDALGVAISGFMAARETGGASVGISIQGKEVAKLEPNQTNTSGKLTIADMSGSVWAQVGQNTKGTGAVCAYGSSGPQCLAPK
jgi:hypothetical protein